MVSFGILVAAVAGVSTTAAQSGGLIELSDVPYAADACGGIDAPGLKTIYVIHSPVSGAMGSRFRVQSGPGLTMTYVSETHHFAQTTGNTQTGITICYDDGCSPDPYYLVATLTYMRYGTTDTCSELMIVPHPDAETVEAIDCAYQPVITYVQNFISTTAPCACPPVHGFAGTPQPFGCSPLPVEETTWGRIKAFYR